MVTNPFFSGYSSLIIFIHDIVIIAIITIIWFIGVIHCNLQPLMSVYSLVTTSEPLLKNHIESLLLNHYSQPMVNCSRQGYGQLWGHFPCSVAWQRLRRPERWVWRSRKCGELVVISGNVSWWLLLLAVICLVVRHVDQFVFVPNIWDGGLISYCFSEEVVIFSQYLGWLVD